MAWQNVQKESSVDRKSAHFILRRIGSQISCKILALMIDSMSLDN